VRIDHVIWTTSDLDTAAQRMARERTWLDDRDLPLRLVAGDPRGLRAVGLGSGAVIR
jgi:hypothetical protein